MVLLLYHVWQQLVSVKETLQAVFFATLFQIYCYRLMQVMLRTELRYSVSCRAVPCRAVPCRAPSLSILLRVNDHAGVIKSRD